MKQNQGSTGVELIAQERVSQIYKHHRTIDDDVKYNNYEQLRMAATWLISEDQTTKIPTGWNVAIWRKMQGKSYKERLIIAGALIAAEIDRLNHSES